jgi:ATP adenylyltransferase/5',5'''-P-1,P-4-tetraphosphate phosphorylase II
MRLINFIVQILLELKEQEIMKKKREKKVLKNYEKKIIAEYFFEHSYYNFKIIVSIHKIFNLQKKLNYLLNYIF